jgi:DNA polymerase (family X)
MKNVKVANILDQLADVLEFKGEMTFKINAYRKAARTIAELPDDIEKIWKAGKLSELPGVGKGIQGKVDQFLAEGKISQLENALKDTPKDLFLFLKISNFGPKTIALAYKQLAIDSLDDLSASLENGSLATLAGMGEKKVKNIQKGLELLQTAQKNISIGVAYPLVIKIIEYLKENSGNTIQKISPAGSVRRGKETVHDVDILAVSQNGKELIEAFSKMPRVTKIFGAGETKGSVFIDDRFQVDLRVVNEDEYGAALQYFTGSKEHNVKLREIARKNGYKINEYGIWQDDKKVGGKQEEDIYHLLEMSWVPLEIREDKGEIEAALKSQIPELITPDQIKADLHIHSNYSDGQLTLEKMASHVKNRGYSYMAFTDHSKYAVYANGLDEKRLLGQIEKIRKLNDQFNDFQITAGIEADILPDGSVDFADDILQQLDFVIASIHSAFKTDPTARTIAAMENQYVDVIGHPTGRLISRREAFSIDMDSVLEVAAKTGTALEINSYWDRLDLSDNNVRKAIDSGVKLSINTDAHDVKHLPMMMYGISTARRGWATAEDIINTFSLKQLLKWQKRNN